ncbi:MAG: hypothetical protein AB1714_25360 [Acidobacteriota bacterium]
MGLLGKIFGANKKTTRPAAPRKAQPLSLSRLSPSEARLQELLEKTPKARARAAKSPSPSAPAAPPPAQAAHSAISALFTDSSTDHLSRYVGAGAVFERELREIQANLIELDDRELDGRITQVIERLQACCGPGVPNGEQIPADARGDLYDLLLDSLSIAKFPKSRASLRPLLEVDLRQAVHETQGQLSKKILSHLNCSNILEIAKLRELQRFFRQNPSLSEHVAIDKVWEYQLTPTQYKFFQIVGEKYPSLRGLPEIFQTMSDAQIYSLTQHVYGRPEAEFRANLAKMRILRDRRSPEAELQRIFTEQFERFVVGLPGPLQERLAALPREPHESWTRAIAGVIVEHIDSVARQSDVIDASALEKDRWAVAQLVEKGMFNAVAELLEKFTTRAAQPRELVFELQKRNTRYFCRHAPYWVAIVEVIARNRDQVIIDGNLSGEGPLGGVPVERERINVSERIRLSLKDRDFSSVSDSEIAEKTERGVQMLGKKLSQTGNFLSLFYETLYSSKPPSIDEIEYLPRSIRAIQTEGLEETNAALATDGKELRPTEEEIFSTLNNLEPVLDLYPALREKGGLDAYIYQRYEATKKEQVTPAEAVARRREVAERLNIAISQVLMPWLKRCRENLESALAAGET